MLPLQNSPSGYRIPVRNGRLQPQKSVPGQSQQLSSEARPDMQTVQTEPEPEVNMSRDPQQEQERPGSSESDWKAIAIRLKAEMASFRERQRRQIETAAAAEKERLFRHILPVIDNLERAIGQNASAEESLRQGVELTHREFMRLMEAEGVSRLETVGQPFDPNWHEALATAPASVQSDTVIEEIEAGYSLNGKLLRPARVVVAT